MQRIAQLQRLIALLDARRNQLFAPLAPLLLWGTQIAMAIEAWRRISGAAVGRWLAAVGEFEALCALAGYMVWHANLKPVNAGNVNDEWDETRAAVGAGDGPDSTETTTHEAPTGR